MNQHKLVKENTKKLQKGAFIRQDANISRLLNQSKILPLNTQDEEAHDKETHVEETHDEETHVEETQLN